jgi:DNA-binding MarR family transcriptional regulator
MSATEPESVLSGKSQGATYSEHVHDNPGFLMASTVFRLDQALRNKILRRLDISYTHYRVMQVVYAGEAESVGEISRMIVVPPAVLSRVIDQMEGRGLVERRTDQVDNRFVNVRLTKAGRAIYEKAWPLAQSLLSSATASLTIQEQQTLLSILRKMDASLR